MEKQERKERKILTENRMVTINKRETSFEGLVAQFENGEDGVYNLINDNAKNTPFVPKISITRQDLADIPELQQVRTAIDSLSSALSHTSGRDAYIIKRTIIDLRKDQYLIKDAYRRPIVPKQLMHARNITALDEYVQVVDQSTTFASGVSLLSPEICSIILCNYSKFKEDAYGRFDSDIWYLMEAFDQVSAAALAPYPQYQLLVELKIDGALNQTIQDALQTQFGLHHSLQYISNLWRKKIPKLIASAAEDQYLYWYYLNIEPGVYKRCSRCGQVKLASPKYFSRNKTSKDGYYSICKCCRSAASLDSRRLISSDSARN